MSAHAFDEIEAKTECYKWVQEERTYLMGRKDWIKVDGGLQRNWKIKRVCQTYL